MQCHSQHAERYRSSCVLWPSAPEQQTPRHRRHPQIRPSRVSDCQALLGSRMLAAERVQSGLLVSKLAVRAINFTAYVDQHLPLLSRKRYLQRTRTLCVWHAPRLSFIRMLFRHDKLAPRTVPVSFTVLWRPCGVGRGTGLAVSGRRFKVPPVDRRRTFVTSPTSH
jgi:hypothetical protein